MTKAVVTLGEIMMRLSVPVKGRFSEAREFDAVYGGAEANVAVSLACMGIPAIHVTRLPDHDLGKGAIQYLKLHDVHTGYIQLGPGRLGLYFLEDGALQRPSRIIYDRFDTAFSLIQPGSIDWDAIMGNAHWFHWTGITPAISQNAASVCLEAIQAANKHKVPVSGDINYRRNLWQYGKKAKDVMPELIAGSQYLVAGPTDFDNSLGIGETSFEEACKSVRKQYPQIEKVAFTYRDVITASHNILSGVIWSGAELVSSQTYEITPIVDRIGGGDAFMAGLIYGWIHGMNDSDTVEYAMSAAVLKHSIVGDANTSTVDEINQLLKGDNTGKLLR